MSRTVASIAPTELKWNSEEKNFQLIDVRTPLEFDSEHIDHSKNIPLDDLADRGGELKKDRSIVLVCRTGNRARKAAELLSNYDMDVKVLEGGIADWKKAGLDLIEGKKRLSLERQVQLTIGLLLIISLILSWWVYLAFLVVPLLIGCGLVFAGLTGNCGLAILLSKAPWNKLEDASCCSK